MAAGGVSTAAMRDLECPVCHEVFSTPKILPCGHSLCASPCLQQLAGDQDEVKCPECRTVHSVPAGGVSDFPTNFFICRIVENTKSRVNLDQSRCPGCSANSVLLRRCYHCDGHICGVCRDEHTDIMKKDLIKQFGGGIETAEFDLKEGSTMKLLEAKVQAMHDELDRVTESFYQIIKQRKQELSESINNFKTIEVDKILAQRQKAKDSYVAFCKEKQLILDGDVSQPMLVQMEEEFFDKVKIQMEENDNEISDATLCVDEKVIGQCLSKFGEINDHHNIIEETTPEVHGVQAVSLDIKRDFTKVKRCIGRQGAEPGLFNSPTAIQVSPVTGNIVVADGKNKRIQIFSCQGEFIHLFTKPYDDHKSVKHLEISSKGDIVILGCLGANVSIAAYNENGELIYDCSVRGAISLALAPNGDVHVGMNGSVDVMSQGRKVTSYIIGREPCRADRICIDKSGTIYVLEFTKRKYCEDFLPESDTMFVFNRQFQLIQQIDVKGITRDLTCRFQSQNHVQHKPNKTAPRGSLRINGDKYFLMTDPDFHHVIVYDLQWNVKAKIGTEGITVGGLYHPRDAAVTLAGDLVVVSDNHMMHFF